MREIAKKIASAKKSRVLNRLTRNRNWRKYNATIVPAQYLMNPWTEDSQPWNENDLKQLQQTKFSLDASEQFSRLRLIYYCPCVQGVDLGFSRGGGGGNWFSKIFKNFVVLFLGWPKWFSELSQITKKTFFLAKLSAPQANKSVKKSVFRNFLEDFHQKIAFFRRALPPPPPKI